MEQGRISLLLTRNGVTLDLRSNRFDVEELLIAVHDMARQKYRCVLEILEDGPM